MYSPLGTNCSRMTRTLPEDPKNRWHLVQCSPRKDIYTDF